MSSISKYVRSDFLHLDDKEILQENITVLLGVNNDAFDVLKKVNIETVFDLGTSWLFANASSLSEKTLHTDLVNILDIQDSNFLKPNTSFDNVEDIQALPLEFLYGISNNLANELKSALDVTTIGDFAKWPPRLIAHQLVSGSFGSTLGDENDDILRPRLGEYPTERVYFDSLNMLHLEVDGPQSVIDTPISLSPSVEEPTGFGKPAVGVLLTTSQSWYAKGVTLGHMLHSLALAPGEATRVAVVDWTRQTEARVSESIEQTESLNNVMNHSRAISEVQNAVATELQEGQSMSSGWAESSSTAEGGAVSSGFFNSVLNEGYSDSFSEQSSSTQSGAISTSWSQGTREISAEMTQNVNDRTEQHANSVRNRRASAVREVSQSEHETVSTRIVANYNHMHALTIQYYEVVQVYKVISKLHKAQRCLFIPFEYLDFSSEDAINIVDRFRGSLIRAALNARAKNLLTDTETMVAIKPVKRLSLPFQDIASITNVPAIAAMRSQPAESADSSEEDTIRGSRLNLNSILADNRDRLLNISDVIGRSPKRKGSAELFLPDNTELIAITFENLSIKTIRIDRPGIPASDNTFNVNSESGRIDLPLGLRLSNIKEIHLAKSVDGVEEGTITFVCAFEGRSFNSNAILVDLKLGTNMQKVVTLKTDRLDREKELLKHLQANRAYYSQMVFRLLDTATLVKLMSPFTWNGISLIDQIEPKPIAVSGNFLVFRAPIEESESSGIFEDGENITWREILRERGIDFEESNSRLIPIPTAGVFAEAVLGRSNSAEKLDITRFWNWQDSPIPLQPTEISPINVGTRKSEENLTPGDLGSSVLNIVNPSSLPDPTALSASLSAIANNNLFRDMSGLAGTQSILQSAIKETLEATGQAGQLASSNLQAEAQKQVALSKIAADIAKAAMGIPPQKSTQGISADGAKVNLGKDLDKRGVSGNNSNNTNSTPGFNTSGSNNNSGTLGEPGNNSGGNNSSTRMSGSSREAAYADHSALGYSPGGLGALSNLVSGELEFASNKTLTAYQQIKNELDNLKSTYDDIRSRLETIENVANALDALDQIDEARNEWRNDPSNIAKGVMWSKKTAEGIMAIKDFVPNLPGPVSKYINGLLSAVPNYVHRLTNLLEQRLAQISVAASSGEVKYNNEIVCGNGNLNNEEVNIIKALDAFESDKIKIFAFACSFGLKSALAAWKYKNYF